MYTTSIRTIGDILCDVSDVTYAMLAYSTAALTADFESGSVIDPATGALATSASSDFLILLQPQKAGDTTIVAIDRNVTVIREALVAADAAAVSAAVTYHLARNAGVRFA